MLMNPQIRRIVILLENIPDPARARVTVTFAGHTLAGSGPQMASAVVSIVKIDLDTNALGRKVTDDTRWE
jgi:hypothetical protein